MCGFEALGGGAALLEGMVREHLPMLAGLNVAAHGAAHVLGVGVVVGAEDQALGRVPPGVPRHEPLRRQLGLAVAGRAVDDEARDLPRLHLLECARDGLVDTRPLVAGRDRVVRVFEVRHGEGGVVQQVVARRVGGEQPLDDLLPALGCDECRGLDQH